MKKLFPIAIIAVFGALSFVSCKKSSSSSCVCTLPGGSKTGKDTSYAVTVTASYSCHYYDSIVKIATTTYGCK